MMDGGNPDTIRRRLISAWSPIANEDAQNSVKYNILTLVNTSGGEKRRSRQYPDHHPTDHSTAIV
jgi:hypothetical protein